MAYDSENYVVTDVPQPPTLSPKVRETLVKARGFIEQGWCRGHSKRLADCHPIPRYEYCIVGAVLEAGDSYDLKHMAIAAIQDALLMRGHDHRIAYFNDLQAADKNEVLKLFDAALSEG